KLYDKLVFTAAGAELGRREGGGKALGPADFGAALEAGAAAASKYGGAEEGDRTMLCALAYVRGELLKGVADPGTVGVARWLEALVPVLGGK
ncbi:Putative 3,4-dihydroxy-2-butanone kinase, partial [Auxenochlorella protothecoides]